MPAQSPEQCDELFGRYLNDGDLDQLAALYSPEASLIGQDGVPASGTRAIREALQSFIAQKPKITMKVIKVVRAGDNLAVLYNDFTAEVAGTEIKGEGHRGCPAPARWFMVIYDRRSLRSRLMEIRARARDERDSSFP